MYVCLYISPFSSWSMLYFLCILCYWTRSQLSFPFVYESSSSAEHWGLSIHHSLKVSGFPRASILRLVGEKPLSAFPVWNICFLFLWHLVRCQKAEKITIKVSWMTLSCIYCSIVHGWRKDKSSLKGVSQGTVVHWPWQSLKTKQRSRGYGLLPNGLSTLFMQTWAPANSS